MKSIVYTKEKAHPRIVIELNCDVDLLVACVKDEELDPADVAAQLSKAFQTVIAAMNKGIAKRIAEQKEE